MMNNDIEVNLIGQVLSLFLYKMIFRVAYASDIFHPPVLEFRAHHEIQLCKWVFDPEQIFIVRYRLLDDD
jgi:hypothetical protein